MTTNNQNTIDLDELCRRYNREYSRNYKSVRITKTANRVLNEFAFASGMRKAALINYLVTKSTQSPAFPMTKPLPRKKWDLSTTVRVRKSDYEKLKDIAERESVPMGIALELLLDAFGFDLLSDEYHESLLCLLYNELTTDTKGEEHA